MKFLLALLLYVFAIRYLSKFGVTRPLSALFFCGFASMSLITVVVMSVF